MARTTTAMVVVFLLLVGGVLAYDKVRPPPSADKTVYVVDVKDSDVQRIDVVTPAGSTAFTRTEPFGWNFADTGNLADFSRVSSVVNRTAKLRSSAKVTDNVGDDRAPYGLVNPPSNVTLTMKDGTVNRLLIGSKTVNDASYYALVDGRSDLHTINTLVVGDIEKLVSDPPVPTPTPGGTVAATVGAGPSATPEGAAPAGTPQPTLEPTTTIGLPGPSVP